MPGRRRVVATVVVVACSLLATACGERSEPTGAAAEIFPITVTSADDRPVTLTAPVRRIALLDPSVEALLTALDRPDVAVPVDRDGAIRERELRRFRPDLVVASPAIDERALSRAAAATKAPVYVVADASIREVERSITQLGMMLTEPTAARRLVARIERARRDVARRVRRLPRTSAFVDFGSFTTAPDQTLTGDLLRIAGGENVAAHAPDMGPFDLAELRRADPEVYVTTNESSVTLESLTADKRTRRLRAVRDGRVAVVDAADLAPGPGVGRALEQLARALHPDAYR